MYIKREEINNYCDSHNQRDMLLRTSVLRILLPTRTTSVRQHSALTHPLRVQIFVLCLVPP